MPYQVLSLKYRPLTFEEVVGQNHVTTTLSNAISSNRVAHAILFTGPRGTGKTTIARILARAMNCKKGLTPLPCNNCKTCMEIIDGHCTDVFEIDGASNNSVDQIRDLKENVTYMPSSAKFKIYIIDEVHMLSTAAFNALLKTLEEPPEHVMFIFATTEVHKIPATILSRCQRHDLGRISLEMISSHLQYLSKNEGFNIEKQSLDLIAQQADGSIRDGLSLLDRILSSSGSKQIDSDLVLDSLGILDLQVMHDISDAVFQKNGAQIIEIIEKVNDSGLDLKKFYSDIILHFRNLNVIKICGKESLSANITDFEKEKILESTAQLSEGYLNTILQILLKEESIVKYSTHIKTAIEMVLLKLLEINAGAQIDTIIQKLDTLASQINSNILSPQHTSDSKKKTAAEKSVSQSTEMLAVQESVPPYDNGHDASLKPSQKPDKKQAPGTWKEFLNEIEKTFPILFALLSKARVNQSKTDEIIVNLKNCSSFEKDRLENKKNELQTMSRQFLEKKLTIKIVSENNKTNQNNSKKTAKTRQKIISHPFVVEAQKIFNGKIIN